MGHQTSYAAFLTRQQRTPYASYSLQVSVINLRHTLCPRLARSDLHKHPHGLDRENDNTVRRSCTLHTPNWRNHCSGLSLQPYSVLYKCFTSGKPPWI